MINTRVLHLDLTRAPMQPAPPLPPVFLTAGTRALLPQVAEGAGLLSETYAHFEQLVPGRSSIREPEIICTTAAELPAVAAAQGLTANAKGMQNLILLHNLVFSAGPARDFLPTPVQRICQFLTRPAASALHWFIFALPADLGLELHGVVQRGMTSSPQYSQMYCGVERMTEQALRHEDAPADAPSETERYIATYLSGALWHDIDPRHTLLPVSVILHEAAHVVHMAMLRQWIDRNAARDAGHRSPAFARHCQPGPDGNFQVDFAFATLFLELAACMATGTYFDMLLTSQPGDRDIAMQMATSLGMAFHYVTDPRFAPLLAQAGAPRPTTRKDIDTVVAATQQFTDIVFGDQIASSP